MSLSLVEPLVAESVQAPPHICVDDIKLSVLDAEQALAQWDFFTPYLEPVFARSAGRIDLEGTRTAVAEGMAIVMMVWNPETGQVFAVMVAEGRTYPGRKVFSIGLCGGHELPVWGLKMWDALQAVARRKGFDQIEVSGRRGWKKFIPGAKEIGTCYAMDLDTERSS